MSEDASSPRATPDWDRVQEHFSLAPREVELARLLHEGLPLKQIARVLSCAYYTADTHRRRLYRKVGEHRRDQVLLKIMRVGLGLE